MPGKKLKKYVKQPKFGDEIIRNVENSMDKLQHEMYLNYVTYFSPRFVIEDKLQHEMYLNKARSVKTDKNIRINFNMRCI